MRLSHLCLATWIASASSFSPLSQQYHSTTRSTNLHSSSSEDNSFLFGAQVPGMPDKPPPAPPVDEDNPMGGQMFRNLMERAKKGPNRPPAATAPSDNSVAAGFNTPPPPPQQQPGQQQYYQPPAQPQQYNAPQPPQYGQQQPLQQPQGTTTMDPYATYQAQLQAWQQQMNSFAQFSAANPQAASQMTMPPPPPPPQPMQPQQASAPVPPQVTPADPNKPINPYDYLPKGDGRNNQSYEVNNAADVYFAQLKRDSTLRTSARRRGDLETANKPFADEGVKALGNLFSDELLASRREQLERNGGEFETSRDEMILPQHFAAEEDLDRTYTGVSYKQKLMEAKKKKGGAVSSTTAASATPSAHATTAPKYVPEVKEFTLGQNTPSTQVPATTTVTAPTTTSEPTAEESQPNFALPVIDESEMEEIPAPSMEDSEETRKDIRSLMGLLLKHRGGPGFGHGRLKDDEAKKLEEQAIEIVSLLKEESGMESTTTSLGMAATSSYAPTPAASTSTSVKLDPSSPLYGAVSCVDAAVNLYKNSDSTGKGELMIPLRDALMSAVETINKQIEEGTTKNSDVTAATEAVTAAAEILNPSSSSSSTTTGPSSPVYATTMEFPETYQVSEKEKEEVEEIADAIAGNGLSSENTARLQKTYDSLKAIAGNKKFGLRDVSEDEVSLNVDI